MKTTILGLLFFVAAFQINGSHCQEWNINEVLQEIQEKLAQIPILNTIIDLNRETIEKLAEQIHEEIEKVGNDVPQVIASINNVINIDLLEIENGELIKVNSKIISEIIREKIASFADVVLEGEPPIIRKIWSRRLNLIVEKQLAPLKESLNKIEIHVSDLENALSNRSKRDTRDIIDLIITSIQLELAKVLEPVKGSIHKALKELSLAIAANYDHGKPQNEVHAIVQKSLNSVIQQAVEAILTCEIQINATIDRVLINFDSHSLVKRDLSAPQASAQVSILNIITTIVQAISNPVAAVVNLVSAVARWVYSLITPTLNWVSKQLVARLASYILQIITNNILNPLIESANKLIDQIFPSGSSSAALRQLTLQ